MIMQIRRVILKDVRNFVDFDCTFEDRWGDRIPESLLLIGPNGSGKTTLLSVIADLWQTLANCLRAKEDLESSLALAGMILGELHFAAMEVLGLETDPLWVYAGEREACFQFVETHENSHRIGLYNFFPASPSVVFQEYWYAAPGVADRGVVGEFSKWQQHWAQRLTENILGKRADLPNVVYLESETRVLLPVKEKFSVQPELEEFRWLARYAPTTARKGSLHNYLYNLKVVNEATFQEIVDQVNAFLIGKRLAGFNRRGVLMVEVDGGDSHSIDNFSSGEKQVLLMIATITRWLRPGGVVLIDEPDLHLHPSLTTAFVSHLRRMVADKGGQLIIASHAPELWREFTPSHRVELGSIEEVRG